MTDASQNIISPRLGAKAFSGSAWMLAMRVTLQGLSLIQVIFLGRLLVPDDFGLMGIALLSIQAFGVFTYTGYDYALVQKVDLEEQDIHTAWWITFFQKLLIGACLLMFSVPIARLFHTNEAVPILISMGFIQCLLGLSNPTASLLQRQLRFRAMFVYQTLPAFVGFLTSLIFALIYRNVWALVLGLAVNYLTQLVLSYFFVHYRPKFIISRRSAAYFINYGVWMFGSAVLWFLYYQGSNAFAGWMFGVAALGIYQMATRFASLLTSSLFDILNGAVLPAVSIIQNDLSRLTKAFLRVLKVSVVVIIGVSTLIAFGLPRLFVLVMGDKWAESATLIPVIALSGAVAGLVRIGSPIFLGTGNTKYQFYVDFSQTMVMVLMLYPLGRAFGVKGIPYAGLVGGLFALLFWWAGIRRSTLCTLRQVFLAILPAFLGSLLMALVFYLGNFLPLSNSQPILMAIWQVFLLLLAFGLYTGFIAWMQMIIPDYYPVTELIKMLSGYAGQVREMLYEAFGQHLHTRLQR
jgi:O-antigen/teichoic acid export membrane protein